jgi:hypothetical protein
MAKKAKKRRAWTASEVRELKTLARGKKPAHKVKKTLHTQGGRRVLTSPAKSSTTLSDWAKAFANSEAVASAASYDQCVFINCPFSADYKPIFQAILFAVYACEFRPRSALERDAFRLGRSLNF